MNISNSKSYYIIGDCFNILPLIPDSSIDLILTDPPYGISQSYEGMPGGVLGVVPEIKDM